ncbi:hypothetical protein [Streptomyces sp. NPDC001070]
MSGTDEAADEALSAALADVPPAGAADGEAYAAARADVALLRTQVRLIGDTLATRPAAPVRRPRGRRALALGLAAVVAGAVAVAGVGIARHAALGGGGSTSDARPGLEGIVACASDIAEGTVREVTPTRTPGDLRVVMDVDRRLKPAEGGAPRLTFTIHIDDGHDDVVPPPEPGSRVLVLLSTLPREQPDWYEGADIAPARTWMERALPGARGLSCESDDLG